MAGCSFLGERRPFDAGVNLAAHPLETRPSTAAPKERRYRASPLLLVQLAFRRRRR